MKFVADLEMQLQISVRRQLLDFKFGFGASYDFKKTEFPY